MRELTLPEPESGRALVLGEFGGYGLLDRDHSWQTGDVFVYDASTSSAELSREVRETCSRRSSCRSCQKGLSAAVYTQDHGRRARESNRVPHLRPSRSSRWTCRESGPVHEKLTGIYRRQYFGRLILPFSMVKECGGKR